MSHKNCNRLARLCNFMDHGVLSFLFIDRLGLKFKVCSQLGNYMDRNKKYILGESAYIEMILEGISS